MVESKPYPPGAMLTFGTYSIPVTGEGRTNNRQFYIGPEYTAGLIGAAVFIGNVPEILARRVICDSSQKDNRFKPIYDFVRGKVDEETHKKLKELSKEYETEFYNTENPDGFLELNGKYSNKLDSIIQGISDEKLRTELELYIDKLSQDRGGARVPEEIEKELNQDRINQLKIL